MRGVLDATDRLKVAPGSVGQLLLGEAERLSPTTHHLREREALVKQVRIIGKGHSGY
jgi:hypothetical protein